MITKSTFLCLFAIIAFAVVDQFSNSASGNIVVSRFYKAVSQVNLEDATTFMTAGKTKKKAKKWITLETAIETYGPAARRRMKPHFKAAGVEYPPRSLKLVGLKEDYLLVILAEDADGEMQKIASYPIMAASGVSGPKLKQGDLQVPEGFYKIDTFNPNSAYHLSLRVGYPNDEDRRHARADKRTTLGGDIMIHGNEVSAGCLAMGDEAIEEIFVLVHDVGRENVDVILAPCDLSVRKATTDLQGQPAWVPSLYKRLKTSLAELPL